MQNNKKLHQSIELFLDLLYQMAWDIYSVNPIAPYTYGSRFALVYSF